MAGCKPTDAAIIDRVTATIHDAKRDTDETFQLDIAEEKVPFQWQNDTPSHSGFDFVEDVRIICQKGCSSAVNYSEQLIDSPIAVFCLSKNSPDLVTLWATGSAYMIRIYHVGNSSITKVLDQGTLIWPHIKIASHGSLFVLLAPGLDANFPTVRIFQLWRWNGKKYYITGNYNRMLF